MAGKRIAIPLARFEPNRALSSEVYLRLHLNRRAVRLAHGGDTLAPELLTRLLAHGHTHLDVTIAEGQAEDPATYPLYLDELNGETTPAISVTGGDSAATEETAPAFSPLDGETRLGADGQLIDPAHRLGPDGQLIEAGARLSADAPKSSTETRLSAGDSATDEAQRLGSPAELTPEEIRIRAIEEEARAFEEKEARGNKPSAGLEPDQLAPEFTGDPDSAEALIAADAAAARRERQLRGPDAELDRRLVGGSQEEETKRRISAGGEETDGGQTIGATAAEKEVVFQVSAGDDEAEESAVFRLEQKLEAAKETLLAGGDFDLEKEKIHILRDAQSSILVTKIAERILELSRLSDPTPTQQAEAAELREALKLAEIGAELPAEILARFSVQADMLTVEEIVTSQRPVVDQVVDLSDHMGTFASARDEARELMQREERELSLGRSATIRDLPQTVSRLATYLAVSLGYVNQAFLTDLAVGAVFRFQELEGKKVDAELIPAFAQDLLSPRPALNSSVDDSREILGFLEAYLADPECDRLEKEFAKKPFERTAERLRAERSVTDWNLQCWENFVDRGPSLEIHSLCNRAAAQAVKLARTSAPESAS